MMFVPMMSAGIRSGVNWMRLNAQVDDVGERADQQRLAQARHALEQHVAAGEQAGQRLSHDLAPGRRSPGRPRPRSRGASSTKLGPRPVRPSGRGAASIAAADGKGGGLVHHFVSWPVGSRALK